MITGPGIFADGVANICPYRIPVDIAQQFEKISVLLYKYALVTPSKQLTVNFSTPVVSLGINSVDVTHHFPLGSERA
jgi:hypothetical protein